VNSSRLPEFVESGDILYLNDGAIQLRVVKVAGKTVACTVLAGGVLRSRKGVNLPGTSLGVGAFTDHDHDCLKSALENGVDAVCLAFVETPSDVEAVRNAAAEMGHHPFIIAKIERAGAIEQIDAILRVSDGIMIARGDLGVEIPMESIALVQKQVIYKANLLGKPVITAAQMLESMMDHDRPTRAESTDVANAVLDGADGVMLSEESATGRFPVEAVSMLAKIATTMEPHRRDDRLHEIFADYDRDHKVPLADLVSHTVQHSVEHLNPSAVFVSTGTGYTARMISRFKLPVWIVAVSQEKATCQGLQFSYGVHSAHEPKPIEDWNEFARRWVQVHGLTAGLVVLTEGPSPDHPTASHHLEVIDLSLAASKAQVKDMRDSSTEQKVVDKGEPRFLIRTEVKARPKHEAKSEPKPEDKAESAPEIKAAPKPEVKAESAPEIEAAPKPEVKAESAPEIEAAPKPEVKAESAPEIKVEPKPKTKRKPMSEIKAESGPETEVANQSEAKVDDHAGEERFRAGHDHNWMESAAAI
jgi:pyruvate kinase